MKTEVNPEAPDFEQAASQLEEGLKSCRSLLANYRSILAADGEGSSAAGSGVRSSYELGEDGRSGEGREALD